MKKLYMFILFMLLSTSLFAQWTGLQRKALADSLALRDATLDSLGIEIALLSSGTMTPLYPTQIYVGSNATSGLAVARTVSGDLTNDASGVFTIGSGKVTNTKLGSSLSIAKMEDGRITQDEFYLLNGLDTSMTIEERFQDIIIGTAFLVKDLATKQTSTSELYFSEDGIRYVSTETGTSSTSARGGMPVYTSLPAVTNHYNGDFATVAGQTDTDGSGEELHGIYFLYTDQDYDKFWGFAPDQNKVERMIEANYKYELPETITTGTDTINFTTDRNFVKSIMSVAADNNLDLYFANSGYGSVTIWVIGGWNPSGTINWSTSIVGETLMWTNKVAPPLDSSTLNDLFIINFTKGSSTLIVGQWNIAGVVE